MILLSNYFLIYVIIEGEVLNVSILFFIFHFYFLIIILSIVITQMFPQRGIVFLGT
jgi:hypothetical protein